jgi:acyl carrier protein
VCPAWRKLAAVASVLHFNGARVDVTDALLAVLCVRTGGALRELDLDSRECFCLSSDGLVFALRVGVCTGLRRLVLLRRSHRPDLRLPLTPKQAQQLAATCPALQHAACYILCDHEKEAAMALALLPGPLTLTVRDKLVMKDGCKVVPGAPLPGALSRTALGAIVQAVVRSTLGTDEVPCDEPLFDLGLDSMTAVELKVALESRLGLVLPSTLLFDHPTVDAITMYLAQDVGGGALADEGAGAA